MGKASGLFLAAAGAASLIVACVIPWQDYASLDVSPPPHGDVETGADARVASGRTLSRTKMSPEADKPASPPELSMPAPRTALGSPQKEAPFATDRPWLGRELQRELARVGCYEGERNGIWTPATRKAMKAFTDRVNATLPTEEPDYILLALVQGYRDKVCGMPCPAGQGLAEDGRCMPNAILAAKKPSPLLRPVPQRAAAPPLSFPDEQRMGLAGPSASKNPGAVDGQVLVAAAALDAPAQSAPAPGAARRPTVRSTNFGPASFFKQLGF